MADGEKSNRNPHTSTPAPNRKIGTTKKLSVSPARSIYSVVRKLSMIEMVIEAIKVVGLPKKGASFPAIKKWIIGNSDPTTRNPVAALKKSINKGIESGTIIRPPHSKDANGILGWFMLASTPKKAKSSPKEKEVIKKTVKSPKEKEVIKKTVKSPKEKEVIKKTVKSPKTNVKEAKTSKEIIKEPKPDQNRKEAIKKGTKKNVKSPKEAVVKEAEKNLSSLPKAIAKKVTKKNPELTKIPKKGSKEVKVSPIKKTAKKELKHNPRVSPNIDENEFILTNSDEDAENPDQAPELARQKKGNKTKGLKQEKATKTKEQQKIKDGVSKNTIGKGEKVVQPKKVKEKNTNVKDFTKLAKTNREPLDKDNQRKPKNKAINANLEFLDRKDLDITRKDMSDTELDTKPNRPKSTKSYASDTELEVSRRRIIPHSKKQKPEKKALTKKVRKNANDTVASSENDKDKTKTTKSQNQSKLKKLK